MRMVRRRLLQTVCALTLLLQPVAAPAQQAFSIPLNIQQGLAAAAAQGPNQLLTAVYHAVQKNPNLAQAIVNEAARIQPGMGQSLANIANQALAQVRAASQSAAASASGSGAAGAASAAGGLSTGGWVTLGLAAGAGGAMAAAGVGGGGGDNSGPTANEFTANYGLPLVFADQAQDRGATGAGVLVGVGDSGIDTDHPELVGQFTGGQNFMNGGSTPGDIEDSATGTGHGTFVSGIIAAKKNGVGMHGMAYDAQILPIRIFDNSGSATPSETASAMAYAIAQGVDVYNGSYGYTSTTTAISAIQTELDAYATAASGGMILVFAAGNDGLANPYLPAAMPYVKPANDAGGVYTSNTGARDYSSTASHVLAVVSVDNDGLISDFSNRCGVAATWCIAAPGGAVYSTAVGGGYATASGTSFAAPHVAGAAAMLIDRYPSLTSAQVVARLLATTSKAGDYAVPEVYGQGLLNLSGATSFISAAMLPTGASLAGPAVPLAASLFRTGPAFGDGLARSLAAVDFKPVDSFDGAAISTSGSALLAPRQNSNSLTDRARRFGRVARTQTLDDMGSDTVSWTALPGNDRFDPQVEGRITTALTADARLSVGYMDDPSLGFGLAGDGAFVAGDSLATGAFLTPYLAFAQDGMNVMAENDLGNGITVRAGAFTGRAEDDRTARANGAVTELSFSPYGRGSFGLQAGFVREGSTFLGTDNEGAFAFGETTTSYAGFSAHVPVSGDTAFVGSYFTGLSAVDPGPGSLVNRFDGITSDSFSLGVVHDNLLARGDRLGLLVNQPLRVSGGSASLRLPGGVDRNLRVGYQSVRAGLTPSGREIDLEAFYRTPLDEQTDVNASVMYRHEPDHVADADGEGQALIRWQRRY